MTDKPELPRRVRLVGDSRLNLAAEMKLRYERGKSIREVAAHFEKSYGITHQLLSEAGAEFRSRGGYHR